MKEFDFLFENKKPSGNIQILDEPGAIQKNIVSAIETATRVDLKIFSKKKNTYINGSTLFLKILQRADDTLILIDKLIPASASEDLVKHKFAVFLYSVDKVWCAFKTEIAGYDKTSGYFIIKSPVNVCRQQRRRFFRVPTTLDNDINITFKNKFEQQNFRVFDISEGGLSFKTANQHDFAEEDIFESSLYFSSGIFINTSVKIRTIAKAFSSAGSYFKVGAEFVHMQKQDRELVAKYILERQIEEIHKRKKIADG